MNYQIEVYDEIDVKAVLERLYEVLAEHSNDYQITYEIAE